MTNLTQTTWNRWNYLSLSPQKRDSTRFTCLSSTSLLCLESLDTRIWWHPSIFKAWHSTCSKVSSPPTWPSPSSCWSTCWSPWCQTLTAGFRNSQTLVGIYAFILNNRLFSKNGNLDLHRWSETCRAHSPAPLKLFTTWIVLIRKKYRKLKADRFKAKMKFRRTMRDEMMQKAPWMRYRLLMGIINLILSLNICCWRAGKEEEEQEDKSKS